MLEAGTKIKFTEDITDDESELVFAVKDQFGVIVKSGADLCGPDDYVVTADGLELEFMSGLDEFEVV
jgi:hypothetical protein